MAEELIAHDIVDFAVTDQGDGTFAIEGSVVESKADGKPLADRKGAKGLRLSVDEMFAMLDPADRERIVADLARRAFLVDATPDIVAAAEDDVLPVVP